MTFWKYLRILPKTTSLAFILLTLSACSGVNPSQEPVFDTSQISNILLQLNQDNELLALTHGQQNIPQRIASNLSGMGYSISSNRSIEHSHDLIAILGSINEGPTPPGFSFTAGNSNPRALNFQKAEVLPITCVITKKENPEQISAELEMTFAAKNYLKYEKSGNHEGEIFEQLTNDMSTVCYNLLSGLDVPTHRQTAPATTNTSDNAEAAPASGADPIETSGTAAPSTTSTETSGVVTPPPPSTSSWAPTISYEIVTDTVEEDSDQSDTPGEQKNQGNRIKADPRKRIVIKNHGSPIIFSFGHERK